MFLGIFELLKLLDHLIMMSSVLLLILACKQNHLFKDPRLLLIRTHRISMKYEEKLIFEILLHRPPRILLFFLFLRIFGRIIHEVISKWSELNKQQQLLMLGFKLLFKSVRMRKKRFQEKSIRIVGNNKIV